MKKVSMKSTEHHCSKARQQREKSLQLNPKLFPSSFFAFFFFFLDAYQFVETLACV